VIRAIFPTSLPVDAVASTNFHPEPIVFDEAQETLKRRLLQSQLRIDPANMIDHHGHRGPLQDRGHRLDQRTLHVNLQVPADVGQSRTQSDHFFDRRGLVQVLHEIEAHAAETQPIQPTQFGSSDRNGQQGNAEISAALG